MCITYAPKNGSGARVYNFIVFVRNHCHQHYTRDPICTKDVCNVLHGLDKQALLISEWIQLMHLTFYCRYSVWTTQGLALADVCMQWFSFLGYVLYFGLHTGPWTQKIDYSVEIWLINIRAWLGSWTNLDLKKWKEYGASSAKFTVSALDSLETPVLLCDTETGVFLFSFIMRAHTVADSALTHQCLLGMALCHCSQGCQAGRPGENKRSELMKTPPHHHHPRGTIHSVW